MKQMEIPHSKRREWRCEGFEYHSRPFNLVSRYGVKPGLTSRQLLGLRSGLTILPNASAWSARAHASLYVLLGRRGAIRVRKPCRWEPAPARCTVRVANRGPRPVSYGGGEGCGARVCVVVGRAPLARWGCPRRVWGHTPNSGAVTFPGSLHRRYPGSTSDLRRRIGCSWRVVATCMYERVRRTGATGARPWGAYSKFRDDQAPPKPSQKASTLDLGPAEANRVLQKCRSARKRMSAYRAPVPLVASGRQWSPLVIKDPHAQDIAAAGGPRRPC